MPHVRAGEARIFYRWDGQQAGPVLLLSNSLGTDLGMWEEQLPAFGERFRVLRYDTRGHGKSDTTPGDYDIALLGRDVLSLLDALQLDSVHFCGLSLGGMTGQWLGANAPSRIRSLVLASTSSYAGPRDPWDARIRAVRENGMAAVAGTIIQRWFTAPYLQADPGRTGRIHEMLLGARPEGYAACCAAVRDLDLRPALAGISAPTLVISGTEDVALPPEHSRAIAAGIAQARLVEIPGSHLCNIESAGRFTRAVLDFLAGGSTGGRTE